MAARFQAPKGVPEYFGARGDAFHTVREALLRQAFLAGYSYIELPVFEDTELFARGVGESTDVVTKEMYTFADKGERSITLRPEGTAGVVRAVLEHSLDRASLPVKLAYAGPFFRYERPQAGRYRQLQQVGIEAMGSEDPQLDAEVITIAADGYAVLGITGARLDLTTLGCAECRPAYRQALLDFLTALPLDEEAKARAAINPLRVLDDKRPEVQKLTADAPLLIDHVCEQCKAHHEAVRSALGARGVAFSDAPRLVRGLDYYTRTTFEFVHEGLGAQSGIGGGGRYDGLAETLGGSALPGIGFGLGVDRTLLALEAEGLEPPQSSRCVVYGVPLGEDAAVAVADLVTQLRRAGIAADMSYGGRGLKAAMKAADRSGAAYAIVLGERDLEAGTAQLKDLITTQQDEVSLNDIVPTVQRKLS